MMTEAEFLAGAYKTCPGRVEIKDMKWTKKQVKDGWPETMAAVREDGEPSLIARARLEGRMITCGYAARAEEWQVPAS